MDINNFLFKDSLKVARSTHHVQDGGVTANDEGQAAEAGDTVGHPHGQLLVEVLGAALLTKNQRVRLEMYPYRSLQISFQIASRYRH